MTTYGPLAMVEPSITIPKMRTDPFAVLPKEVAIHILSYFDAKELCSGPVRVSRAWKLLADDDVLWKQLYLRSFGQLNLRDAGTVRGGEVEGRRALIGSIGEDERISGSLRLPQRSQRGLTGEVGEVEDSVEPIDDPDDRSFLTFRPSTNALVPLSTSTIASFPLYQPGSRFRKMDFEGVSLTERYRERVRGARSGIGDQFIGSEPESPNLTPLSPFEQLCILAQPRPSFNDTSLIAV